MNKKKILPFAARQWAMAHWLNVVTCVAVFKYYISWPYRGAIILFYPCLHIKPAYWLVKCTTTAVGQLKLILFWGRCVMAWWDQQNKWSNLFLIHHWSHHGAWTKMQCFAVSHHPPPPPLRLCPLSRLWVQSWQKPGTTRRKRRTTCCMPRTSGQEETSTKPCVKSARATPSSALMSLSPCEPGRRVDTMMKPDS